MTGYQSIYASTYQRKLFLYNINYIFFSRINYIFLING